MTTLVANPSGRKSVKDKKTIPNKTVSTPAVTLNNISETINNQSEEFRNKGTDKFQPTAEQMRIASLMSDKKDENDLKPKIEQIVELTGASKEDAAVALFDSDNDMAKAVEMILEDSLDSEWQSTGRKKKTKGQTTTQTATESLTNGNKKVEKPMRPNVKSISAGNNTAHQNNTNKGQRGGLQSSNRSIKKKDVRPNDSKPEGTEGTDIFAKASIPSGDPARRGGSRRGVPRGRGAPRGKVPVGTGRGSRTFMNRGLQPNDSFPNSIDTWTNSTAERDNKSSDDLNTMTVGNWSDIVNANEDWSEEDWTSSHMETKVFTPSTKTISEKDETDQNKPINQNTSQNNSQISFVSPKNEAPQPTMSAILSGSIKRSPASTPGQALLQHIQQSSAAPNINQYNLSQYSKQATESIKSLVGLTSNIMPNDLITSNDHSLDNNLTQASKQSTHTANSNRLKVQNQKTSKIPESAVEMPSNDPISNLAINFGSLEFGTNSFSLSANDSNLFDSVSQNVKPENKNISLLSTNPDSTSNQNSNFRTTNNINQQNKSILQSSVLPPLNDSILNADHRNDKINANTYSNKQQQLDRSKNEMSYVNMAYKQSYPNNDNAYSSAYQTSIPSNVGYYSNANPVTPFGNSNSQSLMASNNVYNSTYNNVNAQNVSKIRDIDSSVTQQLTTSASSTSKPYDASSVGTSLSLMSNSTVTTNVLKNTLSATGKGVHNVPPGVQPTQVLSAPYIMGNTAGMPIPYPYPYDSIQFQTNPRDHGYPYATDVKYNRGSESDMLPVSSQAAGAVQTASQAHNQPYMNTYPPGYGVYFGLNFAHQPYYNAAQHIYPVAQAQTNPGSAGSAFAKANTAANAYGSHSYNSGYESIGAPVQTQDYVNKSYPQQLQPHTKQMSGTNSGDLTGNNQTLYGKNHSQINKNYEKQSFQPTAQFNLSNTTQSAANLSSYAPQYMLPQQTMHHTLASAEQTQQPPGVGNQRSLTQTHKSSASTNPNYAKFANWN